MQLNILKKGLRSNSKAVGTLYAELILGHISITKAKLVSYCIEIMLDS